ncbi:LacI family DNA-binding transcriptional regulator [Chelatococcus sp. GCM10030263]
MPFIRMQDVAREAGVSLMTVSNAFQQPGKVRSDTREKVFAAAAKLGYVPNLIAGNLASGKSRVIAAIVPSLRNSNFARMIQGVDECLCARGYELVLAVGDTPDRELDATRTFVGRRADGIILTGTEHSPEMRDLLKAARVPTVETWNLDGPLIDMAVGFSNYDASREITEFMIARGRKVIGFVGYESRDRRFLERQRAFQETMRGAGLRDDLVIFAPEALGFAGGRVAIEHLLDKEPAVEALICVTDIFAVGALFECMRRGWPVPERFAVAGFGDYEISSEVPPGLTTIRTHGYEIGRTAAEMLVEKAERGLAARPTENVGYQLIVRGSV